MTLRFTDRETEIEGGREGARKGGGVDSKRRRRRSSGAGGREGGGEVGPGERSAQLFDPLSLAPSPLEVHSFTALLAQLDQEELVNEVSWPNWTRRAVNECSPRLKRSRGQGAGVALFSRGRVCARGPIQAVQGRVAQEHTLTHAHMRRRYIIYVCVK